MTNTRTDPLAHVKAGDRVVEENDEDGDCPARYHQYVCTRVTGHPGQHIASAITVIAAVWTDEA